MKRMAFVMTAIGLPMMALLLWRFADSHPPVTVQLAPGPVQPRVSPGEAGLDPAVLEAAAAYAGPRATDALVVGRGGHIVYEKYWNGTTTDTVVETGFDPVLAALVLGTMLDAREVHSLDEPLTNYLGADAGDEGTISLRELMARDHPELDLGDTTDLLAQALERVTSLPYHTLVVQRLWTPLGGGTLEFKSSKGGRRPEGVRAHCCLRARLGDWMRIGELLANDGSFEGNQLTPPRYVDLMLRPAHKQSTRGYFTRVDGDFAAHDVAWLEGTNKQRLWVVPSLKLAILRIGDQPGATRGWDERMIPDTIIRGASGWHAPVAGEGVDPSKFAPH
jgi:CubicO group peptidase (beta-lactamase class C family)